MIPSRDYGYCLEEWSLLNLVARSRKSQPHVLNMARQRGAELGTIFNTAMTKPAQREQDHQTTIEGLHKKVDNL